MKRNYLSNTIFRLNTFVVVVFLLAACLPATAQWKDNMGGNWNNMVSASLGNMINDRLWNRMRAKARARGKAATGTAAPSKITPNQTYGAEPPKTSAAQIATASRFRSTGTQLTTRELANGIGGTPEEKERMFKLFGTLLTLYEAEARRLKRQNDFAFALAVALAVNSSIYHQAPEPDDARLLEIGDTVGQLMAENNPFASVPDRQKQKMYEAMIIFTMLAQTGIEEARQTGDPAAADTNRKLAGQTLQSITGMPPEDINFGAADVAPAAANPRTPATNSEPSSGAATMEAMLLLREFKANEVRATQQYRGKRLRVTGIVESIDIIYAGDLSVTLKFYARCQFSKSQSTRVATINKDEEATLEGTVKGLGDDGFVHLENCTVP